MRFLSLLALSGLLSACAGLLPVNVQPGETREAVIARAGRPTQVFPLANGGQRLQYSLQPVGRQSWNVDLDAGGKVVRVEQALTEANLERIQAGWTRADVEREYGLPAWIDHVASWDGDIMNYRWRDRAQIDMWSWVYLDRAGIVRRAHPGVEYPVPGGEPGNDAPSKD